MGCLVEKLWDGGTFPWHLHCDTEYPTDMDGSLYLKLPYVVFITLHKVFGDSFYLGHNFRIP